ncbi:hypothetical protein K0M31_002890, partial [Melipona bicolor]
MSGCLDAWILTTFRLYCTSSNIHRVSPSIRSNNFETGTRPAYRFQQLSAPKVDPVAVRISQQPPIYAATALVRATYDPAPPPRALSRSAAPPSTSSTTTPIAVSERSCSYYYPSV